MKRPLDFNLRSFIALACFCLLTLSSQAGNLSGVVVATFSDPVLTGIVYDGATGYPSYYDNTSTAVYGIANSTDPTLIGTPPRQQFGSGITWGSNPTNSSLVFFGAPIPTDYVQGNPFDLGTIYFNNGTSDVTTLIFAATMTFYYTVDGNISDASKIGVDYLKIYTTFNTGTDRQNADFITLSGLTGVSFNVYEGAGATAELWGYIEGDPTLTLTGMTLDPGQEGNGFIGNGQVTPEPSSLALLGSGVVGLAAFARRKLKV
jgi:hypothetical protein